MNEVHDGWYDCVLVLRTCPAWAQTTCPPYEAHVYSPEALKNMKFTHTLSRRPSQLLRFICRASLLLCISVSAFAESGKVQYAGMYATGDVFINMDLTVSGPGCAHQRVMVPAAHPQQKSLLSIALLAVLTGKTVSIVASSCGGPVPVIDQTAGSWLYILAQ
jgi:hypothetical protein